MRFDIAVTALSCGLLLVGCKMGPCKDLSDPTPGTCTCSDGQQLSMSQCNLCEGLGTAELGMVEQRDLRDKVLSLCNRRYDFQIKSNAAVHLVLSSTGGNVTLAITGRNQKAPLGTISAAPGAEGNLSVVLEEGSYTANVTTSSAGDIPFRLELNASAYDTAEPAADPGNDKDSADDLGTLDQLRRIGGFVGPTDDGDYYRFEVSQNATLTISVADVQGRVYAQLFPDSPLIDETRPHTQLDASSGNDVTRAVNIARGVYFMRIIPVQGASLYTLALSVEPYAHEEPSQDPGDSKDSAWNAGPLSSLQSFGGYVGVTDAEDYYRFDLAGNATIVYGLQEVSGRVLAQLFEDAPIINEAMPYDQIEASDGVTATHQVNRGAGTYYVRVIPMNGSNALYTLGLSAEVK